MSLEGYMNGLVVDTTPEFIAPAADSRHAGGCLHRAPDERCETL